jgi:uncharacterized membrane protein YgaE (UPF0421/DUF939 family)
MFDKLFLAHPRDVNESYGAHFIAASRFGLILIGAGLACLLHALVPAVCLTTASRVVRKLHDQLVINRRRSLPETTDFVLSYEI